MFFYLQSFSSLDFILHSIDFFNFEELFQLHIFYPLGNYLIGNVESLM